MEKGPPSPSYFNFYCVFVVEEEGERRRKSKDKNRREMNKGEGKTKQGTEKMELIDPLSLISPFPLPCRNKENRKEEV